VRTETWAWGAPPDIDLVVQDIWSTTNPLQAGQLENITFRIENQGTSSTSATFYTRLKIDGSVAASWYTDGLAAGANVTGSTNVTIAFGGTHQVLVEVDYTDEVVESNEDNNVRSEDWWFDGPIFVDGFESGDTSAWSGTTP